MATLNPFDLLGDDDNDDPSQLIASVQLKAEKEKPKVAADKAQPANNKLGGKQQPAASAKSLNPLHTARYEGAGRDGPRGGQGRRGDSTGRSYGGGEGRGNYRRDYNNEVDSGNSNGYNFKPSADGESGRQSERRPYIVGGSRGGPGARGPRRGGEEAGEGQRQRRTYDRHSGTGRGSEMKRNGAGSGNWGKDDDLVPIEENAAVENDVTAEKQQLDVEGDAADANKDSPPKEEEQKEPEDKEMTLDEYEKVLEEKKKALLSLKSAEERKVDAKEFAAMQQLSCKKENDEIFARLGAEKEKKREAAEREEKAKKAVSINEFLKPADGETYRGGRGGRGRGRGGRGGSDRGGYGGGGYGRDVSAPSIEDPGQFPSLGGGK